MKKLLLFSFFIFSLAILNHTQAQTKKTSIKKPITKSSSSKKKVVTKSKSDVMEETYNGHKVYTGPRGGKYYINSHGNKTYIKH